MLASAALLVNAATLAVGDVRVLGAGLRRSAVVAATRRGFASRAVAEAVLCLFARIASIPAGTVEPFGAGWRGSAIVTGAAIAVGIRAAAIVTVAAIDVGNRAAAVVAGGAIGASIVTITEATAWRRIAVAIAAERAIDRPTA